MLHDEDGNEDDCDELRIGPYLLDLPLDDGPARSFTVDVPAGTYREVKFKVHKAYRAEDASFVAAHPEFDERSVRVVGSWNGVPFVFTSDVSAEQETDFSPPLSVDGTAGTDLTLFVEPFQLVSCRWRAGRPGSSRCIRSRRRARSRTTSRRRSARSRMTIATARMITTSTEGNTAPAEWDSDLRMTPDWNVLIVATSESFRTALEGMVRELGALPVPWHPGRGSSAGRGPVLVLGGGVETDAIDLVAELDKSRPVFLVGASTDHRLGSAAVRAGARDYFALPSDLDALRRTLEREGRERRGATEGGRFAAAEKTASGFPAIKGNSEPMRRALEQAKRSQGTAA